MALSCYLAFCIAFIVLVVMQVVHIADAQTSWAHPCYRNPCRGEGSGKNYDCPNVPDYMDATNIVCETMDQMNLWTLDGDYDTSVPFSFLTWSESDAAAGIDWNDCSSSDALLDIETLFVIIHGAAEDPDRSLGSMWDAIAHEEGGLRPYEEGVGSSYYVIAPYFRTPKNEEEGVPTSLS